MNQNAKFQVAKEKVFALVVDENNKVNICLGGYKASNKTFDTFEQANAYIAKKPYELLINICAIILEKTNHEETKKESAKNK